MYYSLAQIIVIARGNDEGWINILVMVVLAAVYGLSALIKIKGNKTDDSAQEHQSRKPQRKPSAGGRGILEQMFREIQQAAEGKTTQQTTSPPGQATRQQTTHPQASLRKYAAENKQARQTQSTSAPTKSKLPKSTPQAQRDFGNLAELDKGIRVLPEITKKVVGLPDKRKRIPFQSEESSYLTGQVIHLNGGIYM